jgi:DNA-binding beta-propeller fold protein YncE
MYVSSQQQDEVNEYDLSTAWDISSGSLLQTFSVSSQVNTLETVFFKSDGSVMYVVGSGTATVFQYQLSTAWDISSASFTEISSRFLDVSAEEASPRALFFKPDGEKMYICGADGDEVNEYDLSTAWDISTASFLQNFSVALQETGPQALFFKPDGEKMYICGTSGDDVNEYDLSTAWDVSSASYNQNFDVSSQESSPLGLSFKTDGTKMYVAGSGGDKVNEYDLSTAWDISSASFNQLFDVSSQDTSPRAIFFRGDGLKMYLNGATGDAVYEYDLSTAWDISSASFLQNFSVASQEPTPEGIFFKPDGLKMYITGSTTGAVYEYDL